MCTGHKMFSTWEMVYWTCSSWCVRVWQVSLVLLEGEFPIKITWGINTAWLNYWQNTLQTTVAHRGIHRAFYLCVWVCVTIIKMRSIQVKQPTAALLYLTEVQYLHLMSCFASLNDVIFNHFLLKSDLVWSRVIRVTPLGKSATVFYS